jgi:hypothetical protein
MHISGVIVSDAGVPGTVQNFWELSTMVRRFEYRGHSIGLYRGCVCRFLVKEELADARKSMKKS